MTGWSPRCYIPSFVEIDSPVPEKKIFDGFLPFMGVVTIHHANMSVKCTPHYTLLLYSKIGVYKIIHYFIIFALKHILWVLVRTASNEAVLTCTTMYVLSKNRKKFTNIHLKIIVFTAVKKLLILHRRVCVMLGHVTSIMSSDFQFLVPESFHTKFGSDRHSSF